MEENRLLRPRRAEIDVNVSSDDDEFVCDRFSGCVLDVIHDRLFCFCVAGLSRDPLLTRLTINFRANEGDIDLVQIFTPPPPTPDPTPRH